MLQRVCVFCGSSPGHDPRFREVAQDVGRTLAEAGLELVYGGGRIGLMGAVAEAALAAGGRVTGIIPEALDRREVGFRELSEFIVVDSMHERKRLMAERSDAFVALPGGFGTFEEFCEILTWAQLGIHAKPVGLLDVEGYYEGLLAFLDRARDKGFVRAAHHELLIVDTEPGRLIDRLASRTGPARLSAPPSPAGSRP